MEKIKSAFTYFLTNFFSSFKHSPSFQLKKNRYAFIVRILLSIAFLTTFFFLAQNTIHRNNIPILGDSLLTTMIIEKENELTLTKKTIETQQQLQTISQNAPISFVFYRILPGENVSSVAQKFGLSMATVLSLNNLNDAHSLSVGQKILLSTRSGILVNFTNKISIPEIAELYGISENDTVLVNNLSQDFVQEGTTLFLPEANLSFKAMAKILGYEFINPVPGYRRISSHFGWRTHPILKRRILHKGTDFAAPTGTPIYAPKEGRVISAGWNGSFGLATVIRHNNGYTTLYAHQSKIYVKAGQWVTVGQRIGSVGNTGRSTGPHLHFELHKYGQAKNAMLNGLQL